MRTRVSAYGLAVNDGHVLLTLADLGAPHPRQWTLPGGGIDFGEPPEAAMVREVHEETGLQARNPRLLAVFDVFVEESIADGKPAHAIHIVYRIDAAGEPRVVEEGGTTVDARWFPRPEVETLDCAALVVKALHAAGA